MPVLAATMPIPPKTASHDPEWVASTADQCVLRTSRGSTASVSNPKVQVTKRWTDTIVACPSRPSRSAALATPSRQTSIQAFVGGTCQALASSASTAYAAMTAVTVSQPSRLIQLTRLGARLPLRPNGTRDRASIGAPPPIYPQPLTPRPAHRTGRSRQPPPQRPARG